MNLLEDYTLHSTISTHQTNIVNKYENMIAVFTNVDPEVAVSLDLSYILMGHQMNANECYIHQYVNNHILQIPINSSYQ